MLQTAAHVIFLNEIKARKLKITCKHDKENTELM